MESIQFSTPYLPCRQQVVTSNTGPILVFPRIQPFGSDKLSSLDKVYSRQATESVNCENYSVSFVMSGILHQYKICSLFLVVITFQFVPYIFAIDLLQVVQGHQSKVCVSSSHLARTMGQNVLPQQVSLFYHGKSHIIHLPCSFEPLPLELNARNFPSCALAFTICARRT